MVQFVEALMMCVGSLPCMQWCIMTCTDAKGRQQRGCRQPWEMRVVRGMCLALPHQVF